MSGQVDVVVVGAGLAGLRAADLLRLAGRSVCVLEARDRVGGRTCSEQIGRGLFDVGGQWIGPGQNRLAALVKEFGLRTFPTFHSGKKVLERNSGITTYKSSIPSLSLMSLVQMQASLSYLEHVRKQVDPDDPLANKNALKLDQENVATWRRRFLRSSKVAEVMDIGVRTIFGAEASEISVLYFLMYLNAGGGFLNLAEIENAAQQDRFVTGSQSVSKALAERLGDAVKLSAPVHAIRADGENTRVMSGAGEWLCKHVVVAVPPALAARIRFEPGLPQGRDVLMQNFSMGSTVKVFVNYKEAFWRKAGYSGEAISTISPISVVFDNTSHDDAQPQLVCFIVGKHARRWSEQPQAKRREIVRDTLVRYFGNNAAAIEEFREQDWTSEVWSRGCPTGVLPSGVLTTCADTLREPIGSIHWAGTETAREWMGYMEGALESAERVAREISGT